MPVYLELWILRPPQGVVLDPWSHAYPTWATLDEIGDKIRKLANLCKHFAPKPLPVYLLNRTGGLKSSHENVIIILPGDIRTHVSATHPAGRVGRLACRHR